MNTARLTVTDDIDLAPLDLRDGIDTCPSCAHPRAAHDATAQRFCAATTTMSVARRCICRQDALENSQRAETSHRFGYASTLNQGR
jgi:hypothetical protein